MFDKDRPLFILGLDLESEPVGGSIAPELEVELDERHGSRES